MRTSKQSVRRSWLVVAVAIVSVLVGADAGSPEAASGASRLTLPTPPPDPNPTELAWNPHPRFDSPPVVSPDGAKIAWSESDGSTRQIAVANADGSDRVFVSSIGNGSSPTENGDPAWSPDGRALAWSGRDGSGVRRVFTADVDGMNRKQISSAPGDPFENSVGPVWSPDGSQIAWWTNYEVLVSCNCTANSVFVANADGTDRVTVSDHPDLVDSTNHRFPVWRADGERLYWAAQEFFSISPSSYLVSATPDGTNVCLYGGPFGRLPCLEAIQGAADTESLVQAERLSLR